MRLVFRAAVPQYRQRRKTEIDPPPAHHPAVVAASPQRQGKGLPPAETRADHGPLDYGICNYGLFPFLNKNYLATSDCRLEPIPSAPAMTYWCGCNVSPLSGYRFESKYRASRGVLPRAGGGAGSVLGIRRRGAPGQPQRYWQKCQSRAPVSAACRNSER